MLPLIALFFSSLVLLPLLCALVAGDIVATEDGNQTLKTVLTRSTSRLRLLGAKMAATATYVLVLLVLFGVSGTVIGAVAGGAEPVPLGGVPLGATGFTLGVQEISVPSMLGRLALAVAIYAGPLLAVSAWGFALSTLTRNSGGAIVGMLVFSFANQIIGFLPGIPETVTRWLLTDQFTAWQTVLGTTHRHRPDLARAAGQRAVRRAAAARQRLGLRAPRRPGLIPSAAQQPADAVGQPHVVEARVAVGVPDRPALDVPRRLGHREGALGGGVVRPRSGQRLVEVGRPRRGSLRSRMSKTRRPDRIIEQATTFGSCRGGTEQ